MKKETKTFPLLLGQSQRSLETEMHRPFAFQNWILSILSVFELIPAFAFF